MYGTVAQLRLVAEQAGREIGASPPFAVAAVPAGVDMRLDQEYGAGQPLRGMSVATQVRSDSGDPADLDNAPFKERIETAVADGCFVGITSEVSDYTKSHVENHDRHRVDAARLTGPGLWEVRQTHVYLNRRTGSAEVPMPDSGFVIRYVTMTVPGTKGLFYIVTKRGAATTALGVTSSPGMGIAQTRQDIG